MRVGGSWGAKGAATAFDLRDQYRAWARQGLFRLMRRFNLMFEI